MFVCFSFLVWVIGFICCLFVSFIVWIIVFLMKVSNISSIFMIRTDLHHEGQKVARGWMGGSVSQAKRVRCQYDRKITLCTRPPMTTIDKLLFVKSSCKMSITNKAVAFCKLEALIHVPFKVYDPSHTTAHTTPLMRGYIPQRRKYALGSLWVSF